MKADALGIGRILGNQTLLKIPFYQRSYVWKEEDWIRFLECLETISQRNSSYFFGSIILKSEETSTADIIRDVRDVVDGQQRLTTFMIFMRVLSILKNIDALENYLLVGPEDGRVPALLHNMHDNNTFKQIIESRTHLSLSSKDRISKAYNFFFDNIGKYNLDYYRILQCVNFVVIDLNSNDDEQQIFDAINSLGVRLTTGELLKNYLFHEGDKDNYIRIWYDTFEKDDDDKKFWEADVTKGRIKRNNLETLLYAYLHVKLCTTYKNSIPASDREQFRSAQELFNQYKKFMGLTHISSLELAEDIARYAEIYNKNIDLNIENRQLGVNSLVDRINLIIFRFDVTTAIPYLLYVLDTQKDKDQLNELLTTLESYLMRRIVCRATNKNYSDFFSKELIEKEANTKEKFIAILSSRKVNESLRVPTNKEVSEAIHNQNYTNAISSGILYIIESGMRNHNRDSLELSKLKKYDLEHLMPKKWTNNWSLCEGVTAEERSRTLLTLGNLALLSNGLNRSISNSSWADKLKGKNNDGLIKHASGLHTMYDVLEHTVWDEISISERADKLIQDALTIWPFDFQEQTDSVLLVEDPIDDNDIELESDELDDSYDDYENEQDADGDVEETPKLVQKRTNTLQDMESSLATDTSKQDVVANKTHTKRVKYSINGGEALPGNKSVLAMVQAFVSEHGDYNLEQLRKVFSKDLQPTAHRVIGFLVTDEDLDASTLKNVRKRYFTDSPLMSSDGHKFYVNNQWTTEYVQKVAMIVSGYGITIKKLTNELAETPNA